jgi:hypothetical protein
MAPHNKRLERYGSPEAGEPGFRRNIMAREMKKLNK